MKFRVKQDTTGHGYAVGKELEMDDMWFVGGVFADGTYPQNLQIKDIEPVVNGIVMTTEGYEELMAETATLRKERDELLAEFQKPVYPGDVLYSTPSSGDFAERMLEKCLDRLLPNFGKGA